MLSPIICYSDVVSLFIVLSFAVFHKHFACENISSIACSSHIGQQYALFEA